jgi:putative heme-binding domain-containing protein
MIRALVLMMFGSVAAAPLVEKRAADAPPELQMLLAGFEVKQLPVQLTNLVNVQYRHDGKLVALGYNGNVWLLSDTNGDGLEDKTELFWEGKGKVTAPIGMDLAPKGSPHGESVFFACKGKVMMITDTNGDGKADAERVIAEGWPLARAGVDTASVCYDQRDHSIYFGLGVRWYNNAYELDADGKARNDLSSERGAILRIAPDLKSREKLCTGVRWPIGLRFNQHGDLFCTDQEGATWLPNGNPFDELLLIERGKHYGFPPRHPVHLPNVLDEPSVYDYGPQHQSTCGLRFNEGTNGGPHFGPEFWKHDALVAGESRGKIYRTKLIKTEHGYVAQNQIIACLNQLAVDVEVTPRGDLLVATHSGEPDWGSGPEGKGTVFVVRYADRSQLQPLLVGSLRADTFVTYLAKPAPGNIGLNPTVRRGLYHRAGDDYETMWPGYQVISLQQNLSITQVKKVEGRWSDDRTKLFQKVEPVFAAENYSFKVMPRFNLDTQLSGVEVTYLRKGEPEKQAWLPHLSTEVSAALLHQHLPDLSKCERVVMRTRLDLWSMLRPLQQPGTFLDAELPAEEVTIRISSPNTEFALRRSFTEAAKLESSQLGQITHDGIFTLTPKKNAPVDLVLTCRTDEAPKFELSWHTKEDPRERALPLHRFLVPWCKPELTPGMGAPPPRPEIAGGDWKRGESLFKSDRALCSKCHAVRGSGGKIGPDLSNLTSRDFGSVKRDINDPGASLNPDYTTYEVKLKDGRLFGATMRTEGDEVVLGIGAGVEQRVKAAEIASQTALKVSIMPPKLDEVLGKRDFRDLMAYLLTEPPLMKVYAEDVERPAKRSRAEIDAALAGAPNPPEATRPLKITLCSGAKDHGKGEHDYPRWREVWSRLFTLAEKVDVGIAEEWPSDQQWMNSDVVVFFKKGNWTPKAMGQLDALMKRGGGAVFIHWAVEAGEDAPALSQRLGLSSNRKLTKYRHGPIDLVFDSALKHPIARGMERVKFVDETYWNLVPGIEVKPLASAVEAEAARPQAWTQQHGEGRVFVTLGGHYSWNFDDPLFRVLLLRGMAWTAREPVDRFNNLIEAGLE